MGAFMFFSPGALLVVILTIALLYIVNLILNGYQDRKIIITICVVAIGVRFIFALANYYISYSQGIGSDLIGDARAYSGSGQYIAEVLTNKPMPDVDGNEPAWLEWLRDTYKGSIPSAGYRVDNFAKYVGLVYSIFGYDPIAVKLINSFLSVFTGILLFFLTKDMFSAATAKIALVLSIFWPSLFFWSVTGTKDALTIFLIILWVFSFMKLRKYINIWELFLAIAMLVVTNYAMSALFLLGIFFIKFLKKLIFKQKILSNMLITIILLLIMKIAAESLRLIRFHIFIPLLIAFSLSAVSFLSKRILIFLLIIIFCSGIFLPFFYVNKYKVDIDQRFMSFAQKAITIQKDQLRGANSGYKIYPDRFYDDYMNHSSGDISLSEFVVSYLKGVIYAIFSPFPWFLDNKVGFLIILQAVLYYLLIPFIFLGAIVAFRYRWRDVLHFLCFLFLITSMYALFEGNAGTVFRHRDILMIFFLFFGAIGISKTLNILTANGYVKRTV